MAFKQANQLTTLSGIANNDLVILFDSSEVGDEKLKQMEYSTFKNFVVAAKEDAFSKNTAFNKDFGITADSVCEGDDSRLSDSRTPTSHDHILSEISDLNTDSLDMKPYLAIDTLGGQQLTTSTGILNLNSEGVADTNYTLSNDEVTINSEGTYWISYTLSVDEIDDTGYTRTTVIAWAEEDGTGSWLPIPGSYTRSYHRELTPGTSAAGSFPAVLGQLTKVRIRFFGDEADSLTGLGIPAVQTAAGQSHVSLFKMNPDTAVVSSAASVTSPLTTKGDVWVHGATDNRLPAGSNGQILTADSNEALGVKWGDSNDHNHNDLYYTEEEVASLLVGKSDTSHGHTVLVTGDHGTASSPQVVNVVYGTGSPPAASSVPEGTIWIKYTA